MLTRSLALVVMVLSPGLAQAGELKEFRAQLFMARFEELPKLCNVSRQIWACTSFIAPSLTCHCTRSETGWSMDGTARYLPYLIMYDRNYVKHEMLHLADIRKATRRYLAELSQRSYQTEGQCLGAAASEQAGFAVKLDQFKIASMAKRDTPETLEAALTRAAASKP